MASSSRHVFSLAEPSHSFLYVFLPSQLVSTGLNPSVSIHDFKPTGRHLIICLAVQSAYVCRVSCQAFVTASNCLATRPHNYALGRPSVNQESLCNPGLHTIALFYFFLYPASLIKFVYLMMPAMESHIPQDESCLTRMKPSKSDPNTFNSLQNIPELDAAAEYTIMSLVKPAGLIDLPPQGSCILQMEGHAAASRLADSVADVRTQRLEEYLDAYIITTRTQREISNAHQMVVKESLYWKSGVLSRAVFLPRQLSKRSHKAPLYPASNMNKI